MRKGEHWKSQIAAEIKIGDAFMQDSFSQKIHGKPFYWQITEQAAQVAVVCFNKK